MIEVLEAVEHADCSNCGEKITRYLGDLGSESWSHDSTGRNECPGSLYADPLPPREPGCTCGLQTRMERRGHFVQCPALAPKEQQ